MKRILLALCIFLVTDTVTGQDTTWIQTLTFDDITKRRDWFEFPNGSEDYRKILMYYTLKCDAATTQDGYACGEWDYLTYSFVYDHTGVLDSNLTNHPHYLYGGYNLDSLWYSTSIQSDTIESYEYFTTIDNVVSETGYEIGTANTLSVETLGGYERARSQYIWTATELLSEGVTAGDIQRLRLQITDLITNISNVSIKMKNTSSTNPSGFEDGGTLVFEQTSELTLIDGFNYFNLLSPFNWDGTSSILIELSYENVYSSSQNNVNSEEYADTVGVHTSGIDNAAVFEEDKYMEIPLGGTNFGDEITVSFWSRGNPDIQPANSYSFEAVNTLGQRVLNVHLPWSNGNIYWDAGEGSGYDRIYTAATVAEYEGNWVHWAFTKNSIAGTMNIFKNGVLWLSGTELTRSIGEIDRFILGKGFSANSGSHNGMMDEFQVWDVELGAEAISEWMNKRVDNSHPNYNDLIAYYNFDQSNYALTDQSGNGNTPILVGAPQTQAKSNAGYFLDAALTANRPTMVFFQGTYDTHLDSNLVSISMPIAPTTISEFEVQGNSIQPLSSTLGYAGYTYTYHVDGTVDSTLIISDQASYNDTLWYYQHPYEIIDRYEIGRFITPYGIQLSLGAQGFTWVYDVTDYAHLLKDSVDLVNGNQQELIDVKFAMIKGTPPADVIEFTRPWGESGSKSYANLDNDVSLPAVDVDVHQDAEHFKVKTRFTGHGHQSNSGSYPHCCEWKDNTHYLRVNNAQHANWHIWQEHDCAQNPVYPQGGTWPGAREGWCPGDVVKDNDFIITERVSGNSVNLDYDITDVPSNNQGMGSGNYVVAMHLLQYGEANHSLDAEVYEILSPTNWEYRSRTNPYCDDAEIILRNSGETTLSTLTVTYKVDGGTESTFNWTGNLEFMEFEKVTLPIDDHHFWDGDNFGKFIVTVSAPNGAKDEYSDNDMAYSFYDQPEVYDSDMIVRYKTNNFPSENYWEIKDINGDVVANRTNSDANTIYNDTLGLPPGCYTFHLYDSEDDGLSYWAYPAQGTGYCRLKENGGGYYETFKAEFGGHITHGFSIGILASLQERNTETFVEVYPNPNEGQFTMEIAGFNGDFDVSVLNMHGQLMTKKQISVIDFYEERFNLKDAKSGLYFVRIVGDGVNETKRLVVK
ncbi:T9SS type A sorting domain-containing protein [Flavobacteriales bacterium]|nr:T9SS type A sorting domain-containing protein [Flavobacteriales bacterium]